METEKDENPVLEPEVGVTGVTVKVMEGSDLGQGDPPEVAAPTDSQTTDAQPFPVTSESTVTEPSLPETSGTNATPLIDSPAVSISAAPIVTSAVSMVTEPEPVVNAHDQTPEMKADDVPTEVSVSVPEAVVPIPVNPETVTVTPTPSSAEVTVSSVASALASTIASALASSTGSATVSSTVSSGTASGCPAIVEALNGGEKMDTSEAPPDTNVPPPAAVPSPAPTPPQPALAPQPAPAPQPEVPGDPAGEKPVENGEVPPAALGEEEDDDWYAACSDEEKYNPARRDNGTWEPDPRDMVDLLAKVARGEPCQLQWRCPGRRSPTPERAEQQMEVTETPADDSKDEEKVEETKFDFDEDFGEAAIAPITPRRPAGGTTRTPKSSQRRVASLDKIMNDMRRHKKLDDSTKKGEKAANLDSTPRPLSKLKLSPKKLDTS